MSNKEDKKSKKATIEITKKVKKPRKRTNSSDKEKLVKNKDSNLPKEDISTDQKNNEIQEKVEKIEDFDWSVFDDNNSKKVDEGEESLYSSTMPEIEEKQVLDGIVVSVSDREVIVDINFKSDGVISSTEFKYNPDLKVGDEVEILVEKQEDKNGQLVLSHRRARVLRSWERVNKALEDGDIVNGKIKSRTKGGMIAEVFGIEAFLP